MAILKPFTVKMQFGLDDVRSVCNAIHFGDEDRGAKLYEQLEQDPALWKAFKQEIMDTPFLEEIMEGSDEACSNDWLSDFYIPDDEDDEDGRDEDSDEEDEDE